MNLLRLLSKNKYSARVEKEIQVIIKSFHIELL